MTVSDLTAPQWFLPPLQETSQPLWAVGAPPLRVTPSGVTPQSQFMEHHLMAEGPTRVPPPTPLRHQDYIKINYFIMCLFFVNVCLCAQLCICM